MPTPILYIEILRFGIKTTRVNLDSLLDYLNNNQILLNEHQFLSLQSVVFRNIIESNFIDEAGNKPDFKAGNNYYLTSNALAYFINHELLNDFKKDSLKTKKYVNDALRVSATAFKLSLAALIVSVTVMIIQLIILFYLKR